MTPADISPDNLLSTYTIPNTVERDQVYTIEAQQVDTTTVSFETVPDENRFSNDQVSQFLVSSFV